MSPNMKKVIGESVKGGTQYLLSKITNGLCFEFHQLRHGPSWAWVTACVGSTLYEFNIILDEMIEALLKLQHKNGGWSYNPSVPPDADSTLRVLQFFRKIGFKDKHITGRAEKFILLHQQGDGGFSTYLPELIGPLGYKNTNGWLSSHPCVTALAINLVRNDKTVQRARRYLENHLQRTGPIAYWWKTPLYILYEMGRLQQHTTEPDSVVISLALLLKAKKGISDLMLVNKLLHLQGQNGDFLPSQQFRIPQPHQLLNDFTGQEEVVEDKKGIFSTSAAIVALSRQRTLLT